MLLSDRQTEGRLLFSDEPRKREDVLADVSIANCDVSVRSCLNISLAVIYMS